jgi:hypothetical protein
MYGSNIQSSTKAENRKQSCFDGKDEDFTTGFHRQTLATQREQIRDYFYLILAESWL